MEYVGRNKATTFTGFCEHHDNSIFEPIEKHDYIPRNREQEFLFAYRALAKEYYTKREAYYSIKKLYKILTDNDIENMKKYIATACLENTLYLSQLKTLYKSMLDGYLSALKSYEKYRNAMKTNITNRNYHSIRTHVIVFPTNTRLAVSSLINIEYDLEGNLINDVHNPKAFISPIF